MKMKKKLEMTEEIALSKCTMFINYDDKLGYFPFSCANFLVGTGKYKFCGVCCWGYILERT